MLFTFFGNQFHIFEIPLLLILSIFFIYRRLVLKEKSPGILLQHKKDLSLFCAGFILLLIIKIIGFTVAIDQFLVFKDLLKWIEISVFVFLAFQFNYLKYLYWLLFLIHFVPITISLVVSIINMNLFSGYRILPGYPSVYSFSLLLPFMKKNYFISFLCLIFITASVMSITRGVWLSLGVVLAYFLFVRFKEDKKYALKLLGIFLLVVLVAINIPDVNHNIHKRTINPLITKDASNFERTGMIFACMDIFKNHPLVGIGSGNFAEYLSINPFLFKDKYLSIPKNMAPHAFLFQLMAENGIFGLIAMLMMLYILSKLLFDKKYYLRLKKNKEYILGLKMFYLVFMIHLFFGYISGSSRLVFGILIGLILSLIKNKNSIMGV